MNQQYKYSPESRQPFKDRWGDTVLRGGYTQLPNYLIRGSGELGLSPSAAKVADYILSVGTGYASVARIAKGLGISAGTVRKAFAILREKGYVHFIYQKGEANRFDCSGLIKAVQQVAKNIQRDAYNQDRGIAISGIPPIQKTYSNKEAKTKEDPKEGEGYKKFKLRGQKLKDKRPNGL